MKIGIQTWGSDGDILPFLSLANHLAKVGHEVSVTYTSSSGRDYSAKILHSNMKIKRANKALSAERETIYRELVTSGSSMKKYSLVFRRLFEPEVEDMYAASRELCKTNDIVIGHHLVHTLLAAAEKFRCPRVAIVLSPSAIASEYKPFPGNFFINKSLNKVIWHLADFIYDKIWFPSFNSLRKREGLSTTRRIQRKLTIGDLTLVPVSPELLRNRQPDWPDHAHICGYFDNPVENNYAALPSDLKQFLRRSKIPIYMTFGSMSCSDATQATELFLKVTRLLDERFIVQSQSARPGICSDNPNVCFVDNVPHSLVFPKCSLVVHHGGSGTSHAACRAGCPSVVVEHAFDQRYWGAQLKKAGVTSDTLQRSRVTPNRLAKEMKKILNSTVFKENALSLSSKMKFENGAHKAVRIIENSFM